MPDTFPKRTATFLALALLLSWDSFLVLRPLLSGQASLAAYVVFMFGPLAAALVTAAIFDRAIASP
jgi:hypothetical protein